MKSKSAPGKLVRDANGQNADSSIDLKKLFSDFDQDGDGLITFGELKMAMLNFDNEEGGFGVNFGTDVPQTELSAIFEKVDRNKDQRIDFKEFSELVAVVALETKYGKLTSGSTDLNTFEDFDKDKDGLVTLEEIREHLLGEGKGLAENDLKDLFGKADKNKDGKIDVTEFNQLVELIQDKADKYAETMRLMARRQRLESLRTNNRVRRMLQDVKLEEAEKKNY